MPIKKRKKWKSYRRFTAAAKNHIGFYLPLAITYGYGFVFILFAYYNNGVPSKPFFSDRIIELTKLSFESLAPTTIVFAVTEVLDNIMTLFQKGSQDYLWSVATIAVLPIYVLLFAFKTFVSKAPILFFVAWSLLMFFATVAVLIITFRSYKEGFRSIHGNHGLV